MSTTGVSPSEAAGPTHRMTTEGSVLNLFEGAHMREPLHAPSTAIQSPPAIQRSNVRPIHLLERSDAEESRLRGLCAIL
jgi:hypothetical protein